MKKFRLSFSLLSAWMQGKSDQAVNCYFHIPTKPTDAMSDGIKIHALCATTVTTDKRFPAFLPQIPLTAPVAEKEVTVNFSDRFDLKGIFDVLDGNTLYEIKTGYHDSLEWATTLQIPFYFLIAHIAKIPVDRCYILHYNQHAKTSDFCIIYKNTRQIKKAINLIESLGDEIYTFFEKQGFI